MSMRLYNRMSMRLYTHSHTVIIHLVTYPSTDVPFCIIHTSAYVRNTNINATISRNPVSGQNKRGTMTFSKRMRHLLLKY